MITQAEREALVNEYSRKWGRKWYVLPNPVYGSWESALYEFNESFTAEEIDTIKESHLDTKSEIKE